MSDRGVLGLGRPLLYPAQVVLEHGSAMVGFEQYSPLLERAQQVLPQAVQVTLLADRGFEHGGLMRWLNKQQWDWAIRVKSDLLVTTPDGRTQAVEDFFPSPEHAHLVGAVQVLGDVEAHLATANVPGAQDTWAVLSSQSASLQTFALYSQRFGGIEPTSRITSQRHWMSSTLAYGMQTA